MPPFNEQEFKECMQAKINKISRIDNHSHAFLDKMWKQKYVFNVTLSASEKELLNEFFDVQDLNKVGKLVK